MCGYAAGSLGICCGSKEGREGGREGGRSSTASAA